MKRFHSLFLSLLTLLCFLAGPSWAKVEEKKEPLEVLAKLTEYDGKKHTYTVTGDVKVTYRDLLVNCQKAVIYFTPKEDAVTKIVFFEKVDVLWKSSNFQGERVTYYVPNDRMVAEGGTKTRINVQEVKRGPEPKRGI